MIPYWRFLRFTDLPFTLTRYPPSPFLSLSILTVAPAITPRPLVSHGFTHSITKFLEKRALYRRVDAVVAVSKAASRCVAVPLAPSFPAAAGVESGSSANQLPPPKISFESRRGSFACICTETHRGKSNISYRGRGLSFLDHSPFSTGAAEVAITGGRPSLYD